MDIVVLPLLEEWLWFIVRAGRPSFAAEVFMRSSHPLVSSRSSRWRLIAILTVLFGVPDQMGAEKMGDAVLSVFS